MFNVIFSKPPETFGGVVVKTDFKQVLKYYKLLDDNRFTAEEKAGLILRLFFKEIPTEEPEKTWQFLEWFLSGPEDKAGKAGEKVFDFNIDHGRLFAAFYQIYNIDLRTVDFHWWVFLELFRGLPDNTVMMKIIDIRQREVPKKGDKRES